MSADDKIISACRREPVQRLPEVALPRWLGGFALAIIIGASPVARAEEAVDRDVLDTPAVQVGGAQKVEAQPLIATAVAGRRLIAVGLRGMIAYSDDQGGVWHQAAVPVQDDLVAVQFIDDKTGWVVGHDGVVLKSIDGGENWIRQSNARDDAKSFLAYYQTEHAGDSQAEIYLKQLQLNLGGSASLPYLGVYFQDERNGFAVGSFGGIIATNDGGATWYPALQYVDNPEFLNLNAIKSIGGRPYIAGEMGTVFVFDTATRRFKPVQTGYKGSFFDLTGSAEFLLAVGLRGTAYRSSDQGHNWTRVETGITGSIVGATTLGDQQTVILIASDGAALISHDKGLSFRTLPITAPPPYTGLTEVDSGSIAVSGLQGIFMQHLQRVRE